MAQQYQPQYEFRYQRVELLKTESLGIGSYGAVCKAMCDDLPCAAKILHPALFQFTAPGTTSVMRKFEQECHLLSAIKHPHIVQYLGTYHDPESRLPVLLMELMDESLTRFLERSHKPLPYHTEVNFCHDIALALSYFHSNGIVHRDLSSNNVLLIAGSRAKVTDFGMVKLYDVNCSTTHLTPLTLCPGTMVYMSPEALKDRPVYTDKLDSFSLGVLSVQVMTRLFPDPGDRVTEVEDSRYPTGTIEVPVPETDRRQSHINLIDPAHPLLPVALDCLKDRDRERPSCHELCGRMFTLKSSPKYTESVQQSQEREKIIQDLRRQVLELQQQPRQRGGQRQEEEEASGAAASGGSIKLRWWRDGGRAPCNMWGEVSVVDGSVAYFLPRESKSVFAYNSTNNRWSELPECPNTNGSLAIVNSLLTAIGGMTSNYEITNSLLSLTDNKWTKQFPPMPTKRSVTVAVCSGRSLVVAGGVGGGNKKLSTVEVMDTGTLQWSTASSLPHPLYSASATLCADQIYMLGGFYELEEESTSVFTCSLAALLQSCQTRSPGQQLKTLSLTSRPKVWHQLADTPVDGFTCASLRGRLLAVGGVYSGNEPTTAIHMYNTTTNSWEVISHMAAPRCQFSVAILPHNELMVVGGNSADNWTSTDSVEFASIV